MSKELEEESLLPQGELHLSGDGLVAGMGSQDVESHASDDGEILWSVVFPAACVVFMESDIELPVQAFSTSQWARMVSAKRLGDRRLERTT